MKNYNRGLIFIVFLILGSVEAALTQGPPSLILTGKYKSGHIVLRWAPTHPKAYQAILSNGIIIQRRDYKTSETEESFDKFFRISPLSQEDSINIVNHSQEETIAAMGEILFNPHLESGLGGRFAQLSQQIEADQTRYALAMMVADRSYPAACFGKMGFTDSLIDSSHSYLYRIYIPRISVSDTSVYDTAVLYLRPQDGLLCPPPEFLSADFCDRTVTLSWDTRFWNTICTGYFVERAELGEDFKSCHRIPISALQSDRSETNRLRYIDSLPKNGKTYRYRIRGVDLFGDSYLISKETRGAGRLGLTDLPQISEVKETKQGAYELSWIFPLEQEVALEKFCLSVKGGMYETYQEIGSYSPKQRKVLLPAQSLSSSSYFCLSAHGKKGEVLHSTTFFYQLQDSIPPEQPQGLRSNVDSNGCIVLQWAPSSSVDVEGYRIFKGTVSQKEEPVQVSYSVCVDTLWVDTISLRVWQSYYYYVCAVDARGNMSKLSSPIEVRNPKANPLSAPLFVSGTVDKKGVMLRWFPSLDPDVMRQTLYVQIDSGEKIKIKEMTKQTDSFYYEYTSERAFLTSHVFWICAHSLQGDHVMCPFSYEVLQQASLSPPEIEAYALRNKHCIAIEWHLKKYPKVLRAYLYRKTEEGFYTLCNTFNAEQWEKGIWADTTVVPGHLYEYKMQVQTEKNVYSPFSKSFQIIY